MGSGFSRMKKQMKQLGQQLEGLHQQTFVGNSSNDLVRITLRGDKTLQGIRINPECVDKEDVEGLEDLIAQAFSDALKKIDEETRPFGL